MKTIGIIGGMGPQATIRFYDLLIRISRDEHGVTDNSKYPHILLSNLPIPETFESDEHMQDAVRMMSDEAKVLAGAGVDFLVIVCNTMHLYVEECSKEAGKPFLSMIKAVSDRVKEREFKRIGLLGSPVTIESKLYETPLRTRGVDVVTPVRQDHAVLGHIIKSVVMGTYSKSEEESLLRIANSLQSQQIDALILGCTELPLVLGQKDVSVPLLDSLRILAREACREVYGQESKKS